MAEGNNEYKYAAEIVGIILALYVAARILAAIVTNVSNFARDFLLNRGVATASDRWNEFLNGLFYFFSGLFLFLTIVSNIFSTLFIMGIIYALIRISELNHDINEKYFPKERPVSVPPGAPTKSTDPGVAPEREVAYRMQPSDRAIPGQKAWERVQQQINSGNPSDWRVAILEADNILGEILKSMRLPGDSIGEKLKAVEESDFVTLNQAWEAHKIRNQVAHQGGEFLISEREAKRVISLYEVVFREFDYI